MTKRYKFKHFGERYVYWFERWPMIKKGWWWIHENLPAAANGPFTYQHQCIQNIRDWSDDQFADRL